MLDIKGQTFGWLTVTRLVGVKNHKSYWECQCKCDKIIEIVGTKLTSGEQTSCGCRKSDKTLRIRAALTVPKFKRHQRAKWAAQERWHHTFEPSEGNSDICVRCGKEHKQ